MEIKVASQTCEVLSPVYQSRGPRVTVQRVTVMCNRSLHPGVTLSDMTRHAVIEIESDFTIPANHTLRYQVQCVRKG